MAINPAPEVGSQVEEIHEDAQAQTDGSASLNCYISPYCGILAFHKVVKTLEMLSTDEEERPSVALLKYLARIVAGFAISYLSYIFLHINAVCFAWKSLASIWSYFKRKEVFHYVYTDYNKDIDKHIRHGIIDILLYFSSYAPPIHMTIVLLYATFPKNFIEIAEKAVYYRLDMPQQAHELGEE